MALTDAEINSWQTAKPPDVIIKAGGIEMRDKIASHYELPAINFEPPCKNKSNHTSAFPGYGRRPCPWCGCKYVTK